MSAPMDSARRRTARFLAGWLAAQVALALAAAGWEAYAVATHNAALITTVIREAWYAQEWAFLGIGVVVALVVGYLAGHFFASAEPPKE